jgi:hypothetical protein
MLKQTPNIVLNNDAQHSTQKDATLKKDAQ